MGRDCGSCGATPNRRPSSGGVQFPAPPRASGLAAATAGTVTPPSAVSTVELRRRDAGLEGSGVEVALLADGTEGPADRQWLSFVRRRDLDLLRRRFTRGVLRFVASRDRAPMECRGCLCTGC